MKRRKLVDYSEGDSESEGEGEDEARDVSTTADVRQSPPEPQDENEFAQIVIQLQQQYIKEVGELERRQEEAERQLGLWKAQVEERLQLQEVFGVDATNPALRRYTQQPDEGSGLAATVVPPSPSPTPPMLAESSVLLTQEKDTPRAPSSVHAKETLMELPSWNGEHEGQLPTAHPSLPVVRRSTGKKAPRRRAVGASRRPYEAARKPRSRDGGSGRARTVEVEQAVAVIGIDEPHELHQPTAMAGNKERPQPWARVPPTPTNPYDDPKYYSTLTVADEDGTQRPIFKFHRHPETVEEQWAEFRHGLHGQPPVERLEALYRAKWRNSTYGRSWYTRRKAFWDKVKEMLAEGRTEQQALDAMRRLAEGGVPSLIAQLCRERGHGSRPDRRRDRPGFPGSKMGMSGSCDEEEAIDSGRESDECSGTGRTSPLRLRKRIGVSVAGMEQDNDEGLAEGMNEAVDGLWVG